MKWEKLRMGDVRKRKRDGTERDREWKREARRKRREILETFRVSRNAALPPTKYVPYTFVRFVNATWHHWPSAQSAIEIAVTMCSLYYPAKHSCPPPFSLSFTLSLFFSISSREKIFRRFGNHVNCYRDAVENRDTSEMVEKVFPY